MYKKLGYTDSGVFRGTLCGDQLMILWMENICTTAVTSSVSGSRRKTTMKKKTGKYVLTVLLTTMCILVMNRPAYAENTEKTTINKSNLEISVGQTYRLKIKGTSKKPRWVSSDRSIVSVNKKGTVTGKKDGSAKVTAKIGKQKWTCKVRVRSRWRLLLDKYKGSKSVRQLIFVQYISGSKADVLMYKKANGKWKRILKCRGYVGRNGIDKVKEGDKKTPTGVYNLTSGFGIKKNPGTTMPYVKVNKYLYWCGDKSHYNQLIDVRKTPHRCRGEHLINYVPRYNYGMFLDYNRKCIYKKGCAIFLHCTGRTPYTAGCIAVPEKNMIKILKNVKKGAKICIYKKSS